MLTSLPSMTSQPIVSTAASIASSSPVAPFLLSNLHQLAGATLVSAALASPSSLSTGTASTSLASIAIRRSSATALNLSKSNAANSDASERGKDSTSKQADNSNAMTNISVRARSCIYMATAMALHFGGYEFARSGALALYTSSQTGFTSAAAYPFAIGMVTPVSLVLLYWYGLVLKKDGPRRALRATSVLSVGALAAATTALTLIPDGTLTSKAVVGLLFIFQNSYAHLIYTQQWSFLGSVMTPTEGTKWFSFIAGLSSIICTTTASMVKTLSATVGLLGLIAGTCITLSLSALIADRAYAMAEQNGFDPAQTMQAQKDKKKKDQPSSTTPLLTRTSQLFRRVPTLAALFGEVVTFQSLSTILSVCFVRQLKLSIPVDTDRAAFTGGFYAGINGISGVLQFFVLPLARKYLEPKNVYRGLPLLLTPFLIYTTLSQHAALWVTAAAFFSLKTLDYSFRNVVNEMVYQPLDFESRYLGKEVIGVFASRFGKSGMSLLLSFATAQFGVGLQALSQFSLAVAGMWTASSWWLGSKVMSNQEAEARVQERTEQKGK